MPVRVGNTNTSLRVGSTAIRSAFVGTTRVFSSTGTTSPPPGPPTPPQPPPPPGPPTPPQPPPAPDVAPTPYDLSAVRGDGAFTLSWKSALFGSPAFKVQISTDAIAWLDLPTSTITISTINIETATILTAGATVTASPGTYYVRVAGVIGTSRGQYSPATSVTILAASTAPTGLTVTAESDYYLLVTWDSGTTQVVSGTDNPPIDFHLERSKDDGATWEQAAGWRFNASRPPGARIDSWGSVDAPITPSIESIVSDPNYLSVGSAGNTTQNFAAGYSVAGTPGVSYKFRLRRRRVKTGVLPGQPDEPQTFSAWSAPSAAVTMPVGPTSTSAAPVPANVTVELRNGVALLSWDGGGPSDARYQEMYDIEWRVSGVTRTLYDKAADAYYPAPGTAMRARIHAEELFRPRHPADTAALFPDWPLAANGRYSSATAVQFRIARRRKRVGASDLAYSVWNPATDWSAWSSPVGPDTMVPRFDVVSKVTAVGIPSWGSAAPHGGLLVEFTATPTRNYTCTYGSVLAPGPVVDYDAFGTQTQYRVSVGNGAATLVVSASNVTDVVWFAVGASSATDTSQPAVSACGHTLDYAHLRRRFRVRIPLSGSGSVSGMRVSIAAENAAGASRAVEYTGTTGTTASSGAIEPISAVTVLPPVACRVDCASPQARLVPVTLQWARPASWSGAVTFDIESSLSFVSHEMESFAWSARAARSSVVAQGFGSYPACSETGLTGPTGGLYKFEMLMVGRNTGNPNYTAVVEAGQVLAENAIFSFRVRPRQGAVVGAWTYVSRLDLRCTY